MSNRNGNDSQQQIINSEETILLCTLASRIFPEVARQTVAHSKTGAAGAAALEDCVKVSVQAATRILAHVQSGLAQEAAEQQTRAALVPNKPFGSRDVGGGIGGGARPVFPSQG